MTRVEPEDGRPHLAGLADERGSTLPLTIFYGFLSLLLVFLVVAGTSLYLERKRLFTVADGAALVGAESFALDAVARTPRGYRPILTTQQVAAAVGQYLAVTPTGGLESLVVESAGTVDGRSATVSLSSYWRPPVLTLFVPSGLRLEVTAVARSVFS